MSISVRTAGPGDGAILHAVVLELAIHHGHAADFVSNPADLERFICAPDSIGGAFIAFWDGVPAGAAVWHRAFSTFRGRETVYLEDICVLESFRKRGVGQALLKAMARLARDRGANDLHWLMMHWNDDARRFYEAAGAEIEDGNCFCRLSGAALERLAS